MREIRIFIASPDDVRPERERVERVVVGLNREFANIAHFRAIRWEREFYSAHRHPQEQIPDPATCDVVIVLFGNRLGTKLPQEFAKRLPDGACYPSGTAYELLSALAASEASGGRPAVFVFRTTAEPRFGISEEAALQAAKAAKLRLDDFLDPLFCSPQGEVRRHLHRFRDAGHLSAQVDELLRRWAGLSLHTAPGWRIDRDGSPFRGLEPFDAKHSRVFFGRDRKVQRAAGELVQAQARERGLPFLLIVGPSGSGKSSLVRAGLVPLVTQGSLVADVDCWRVAVMKPGASATPFLALAQAMFVDGTPETDPGGFGPALPELGAGPYRAPAQLAEVLQQAPVSAAAPVLSALELVGQAEKESGGFDRTVRADLLLVVDQLEELFGGDVSDAERLGFAPLLTALAQSGRVWIVATLRADLYPRMLDQTSPFLALKDRGGLYDLASPGPAELAEILQKSAAASGIVYGVDPATEERLDERLLRDATGSDALPLLQFALRKLFDSRKEVVTPTGTQIQLTFAAYQEIGGLDGAVDTAAEDAVAGLGQDGTEIDRTLARLLRQVAVRVADRGAPTTSEPGLTVRAVPLATAAPDEASRSLIEILARAHLLVLDAEPNQEPLVRLAHERVLSCWRRAQAVVRAYREYFRIRADIEGEYRRWDVGHRRREFLLSGTPLIDAERLLRDFGPELTLSLRDFVTVSGRHARFRQRLTTAAAATFFVLAVFSTGLALLATKAEHKAERNYAAAKGAADQLVASIARDLREQQGISSQAIDIAFGAVQELLDRIEVTVAEQESFPVRELEAAFGRVRSIFGNPANDDPVASLQRSRADLLYEFAETYHQSANSVDKARRMAEQSLAIRQRLHEAGDNSPDLLASMARAEMTISDLDRSVLDRPRRPSQDAEPADYSQVRQRLQRAMDILDPLVAQSPDSTELARDLSQILTRLGDLDAKDRNIAAALHHYRRGQELALRVLARLPDSPRAISELAWSYRKLAESELARSETEKAARLLASEICLRRRVAALQPHVIRWARDLGFALEKAGTVWLKLGAGNGEARDSVYEALHRRLDLVDANRTDRILYQELGRSLRQATELHRALGDATLTAAFATAGTELDKAVARAFETKLPDDASAKAMMLDQQSLSKQRGARPMLGEARLTVELAENDFAVLRLEPIERSAIGCWERLIQTAELAPATGSQ